MSANSFRADLHCHSYCSDGTDPPLELLHIAKQKGLQGLSITDHDTMIAYDEKLFSMAKKMGLLLLTGVEISAECCGKSVHILAYNVKKQAFFERFLTQVRKKRLARNRLIFEKLQKNKIPLVEEKFYRFLEQKQMKPHVVGRPHIANWLVLHRYVASIKEAFATYLGDQGLCHVEGEKFSAKEVIQMIHQAGAKAVLAHPHFLQDPSLVETLCQLPFDGIEAYYAHKSTKEEAFWIELGKRKGWILTGGSDYHGKNKPYVHMGSSWVSKETFEQLIAL